MNQIYFRTGLLSLDIVGPLPQPHTANQLDESIDLHQLPAGRRRAGSSGVRSSPLLASNRTTREIRANSRFLVGKGDARASEDT